MELYKFLDWKRFLDWILPRWWFSLFWEAAVGVLLGVGLAGSYASITKQDVNPTATLTMCFVGGFVTYLLIEQLKERNLLKDIRSSFLQGSSSSLLRYFHALENTTHFELALKVFDDLGSSRWVMSEFIHCKLKTDFSSVSEIRIANMDAAEYSNLLCALINVTKDSVYMTCPYLPSIWLQGLGIDLDSKMSVNNMPAHFQAFLVKRNIDRRRILNLIGEDYEKLSSDQGEKDAMAICAKPVEKASGGFLGRKILHFVLGIDSKTHGFSKEQIEKWELDYSVFDKSIVVVWRTNSSNEKNGDSPITRKGDCILIFNDAEVKKYLGLFDLLDTERSRFIDIPI